MLGVRPPFLDVLLRYKGVSQVAFELKLEHHEVGGAEVSRLAGARCRYPARPRSAALVLAVAAEAEYLRPIVLALRKLSGVKQRLDAFPQDVLILLVKQVGEGR
jgi:hypothetical protein